MSNSSLPVILRPKTLDEIVGQDHILGKDAKFRKLIESDKLATVLLFGPPGTGKTSLAEVIALTTKSNFVRLNATQASVKDIRKHGESAKKSGIPTTLFFDEIHRASRVQTDSFLPYVENSDIILIGATTENIFHSVSSPIISRAQMICELEPLKATDLAKILIKGINYYKSIGKDLKIDKDASHYMIVMSNGDGRKILSLLEVAEIVAENNHITLELAKSICPSKHMALSATGHFDLASAYQGSIQASDPDAAIYWLAKWMESGEDPRYIARRLMVSASEDAAGNPEAAMVAQSAYVSACQVGRPECDIILAHATVLIASAPRNKSAAIAIWEAIKDVRNNESIEVPKELKDCHYGGAKELGHGDYHDGANQSAYIGISKRYYRPEDWA